MALQRTIPAQLADRLAGLPGLDDVRRLAFHLAQQDLRLLPVLIMREEKRGQRRWLVIFGSTLAALVALATASHLRLETFRDPPFDFYVLKADEFFNVYGLTRRQEGSVKLGFAEARPAPAIGVYGNHIIQYFGADAFGGSEDSAQGTPPAQLFNYWYANLSLPEIESYLRQIERAGNLPKKLLLVQITPPNADNGRFIINRGNELPLDVALSGASPELKSSLAGIASLAWLAISNTLHEILSYNTFILGIVQTRHSDRLISPSSCQSETRAWWKSLPSSVRRLVGMAAGRDFFCQRHTWWGAFRRDGSVDPNFREDEFSPTTQLVANEDPLSETDRGINAGDETSIARYLRNIDEIGRRNGVRVAFVVPPVFETDRSQSAVNQVFDRALALVREIALIDHRSMHSDPALFKELAPPGPGVLPNPHDGAAPPRASRLTRDDIVVRQPAIRQPPRFPPCWAGSAPRAKACRPAPPCPRGLGDP